MDDAFLQRVQELFADALELSADRRSAFLDASCTGPDATRLRHEVEALLRAHDEAGDYLAEPTVLPMDIKPQEPVPEEERPGAKIDRYIVRERLGEGGFGAVYRAEQLEPIQRQVAIKIIKLGMDSRQVVARFEAERQALALMDHPGIATVLDAGTTPSGRPYFVMELVQGQPITEFCDRHQLSIPARLRLVIDVCAAVQHAHYKGIIHRDLKPSNILVAMIGDQPHVKIIDFGIAKAIRGESHRSEESTLLTLDGQFLGTPQYMSPEQAGGPIPGCANPDVDTRTDIYSIGVVLYQLLTGALPFDPSSLRGGDLLEICRRIREVDPPKPSTRLRQMSDAESAAAAHVRLATRTGGEDAGALIRRLRGDLDWIVMKAMERDRSRRYASASELAADLQRHLNGEAVLARPPSAAYRLQKFIARHRAGVAAAVAVALALLLGAAGLLVGLLEARAQRDVAINNEAIAERRSYYALIAAADGAIRINDRRRALRYLNEAPIQYRDWEWRYLRHHADRSQQTIHVGVRIVNASLDAADRFIYVATNDHRLSVWELDSGTCIANFPVGFLPIAAVPSPDGNHVIVSEDEEAGHRVRMFDWRDGRMLWEREAAPPTARCFSPDGKLVVLGGYARRTAAIVDAATGEVITQMTPAASDVRMFGFNADGSAVAYVAVDDQSIDLYSLVDGTTTVMKPDDRFGEPMFSTSEGLLACRDASSGDLTIIDLDQRVVLRRLPGVSKGRRSCRGMSPDGRTVLIAADDEERFELHDVVAQRCMCTIPALGSSTARAEFTRDGLRMITAHHSGLLHLWSQPLGDTPRLIEPTYRGIQLGTAFSRDGALAACGGWGNIQLWTIATGELLWSINTATQYIERLAFSPDAQRIAAVETRGRLLILAAENGDILHAWNGSPEGNMDVAWTPDGSTILLAGADGSVRWIDPKSGEVLHTLGLHDGPITCLALSGDGRRFVTTAGAIRFTWDNSRQITLEPASPALALVDVPSRTVLQRIDVEAGLISAAVNHDGTCFAVGDVSGSVLIFDAAGQRSAVIGTNVPDSLAFNQSGTRLAAQLRDGFIAIADVATGVPVLTIPSAQYGHVAFSPTSDSLLLGTLKVFREYETRDADQPTRVRRHEYAGVRSLVDPLFHQQLFSQEIVDLLRQRSDLPDALRDDAIRYAAAHGDYVARINSDMLWHSRQKDNSASNYELALRMLDFLERKLPDRTDEWQCLRALLNYRLGNLDRAHVLLMELIADEDRQADTALAPLIIGALVEHDRGNEPLARQLWSLVEARVARDGRPREQTERMLYDEARAIIR